MHRLSLHDALSPPGLLSLSRIPLAAVFPLVVGSSAVALGILAAAALTDVLDGWWARRSGRTSFTGAVLDAALDKLFVLSVVVTLLACGKLSLVAVLVLGARDIVLLPLAVWLVVDTGALARHTEQVAANRLGKAVTVLQFGTVVAALTLPTVVTGLAVATGALGTVAGAAYWVQLLRDGRRPGVST